MEMKRTLILVFFFLILGLSLKPVFAAPNPILLASEKIENISSVTILENHPTEFSENNASFEKIYFLNDNFSDKYGFRPYLWGQEIFGGTPEFLCDSSVSRTGNWSFQILCDSKDDVGVLAVPELNLKPIVAEGRVYYLSFWINYDIKDGEGISLIQQFFREEDEFYPSYAYYGPSIKGTSNGEWVQVGLLVRAPKNTVRGDPVIALSGVGKVNVDDAFFGEVKIK